jgi:hypothetical protein
MKKYLSLILVLAMVLCMAAYGAAPAQATQAGTYTPGTYTGVGAGKNGDITVEVTFSAEKIERITVVSHSETPSLSDAAIANIPTQIVESQSLGVDAVSGATYTSNGIVEAVADAVKQAGGDVEALKNVQIASGEHVEEELTTDVVVVGGGGAGMSAAVRLAELGQQVILFEKASFLGGAISVSGGNQVIMGSQLQADNGVEDDSVESMVADFEANGAGKNNEEILTLFAENVGAATDWLVASCGIEFDAGLHQLGEYSHNRELAYTGGGAGFAERMRKAVERSGATVYLSTKVESLLVEDGAVVGVKAVSTDGTKEYTVHAANVVLATGGYGNNKDMLTDEMKSALYYGPSTSTGDGIRMAEAVNAQTANMEYGKRYPNGIEVDTGIAKSTIAGNIVGWTMSAILVNADGNRVVNEKASNRTILEEELQQPGGMLYLLLDSETFEVWKTKLAPAGISEGDIEKYLAANGTTTPVFAHGETLEEAAAAAGVNAENLAATVEKYNSFVEKGEDADFGRNASYLTMKIGAGPYYLIEQKPRFATTMGGLVVNTNMQVLNQEGSAISGLYAAGETCGQVMGDDSPSGANNAWAITSGKLAADAIAAK